MTTYGAYDMGLPCKNRSCKSHGKPHPNCRCYGAGLAEGGEVTRFCDSDRMHGSGCEYYAEGGLVSYTEQTDPFHPTSAYVAHGGLHSLLKMNSDTSDNAIEKYARSVKRGHKYIASEIERVFNGQSAKQDDHSKSRESIDNWISKGGAINEIQKEQESQNQIPQAFAEGGAVENNKEGMFHHHAIGASYPDQNVILNTIKGRASTYLSDLKPKKDQPRPVFDDEPDDSTQKKSYEKALQIAAHPMSILNKIQKGTLESEHVKHFAALYPELKDHLQKKLNEKIVMARLHDEKPSHKIRQGLSLLMGAPLSGEFLPQNIMAAQATFQRSKPQPQGGDAAPKKNTSALSKFSQAYLTADEAAAKRQQKQ